LVRATESVFGLRLSAARPKISTPGWERRLSGDHERRLIVANHAWQEREEREERWADLGGPAAATRRLQDIEMHLGHVRIELREIGRWTEHPACPDISRLLKRAQELLNNAEREVRQARTRRLHG
jgi:hypothetical protein